MKVATPAFLAGVKLHAMTRERRGDKEAELLDHEVDKHANIVAGLHQEWTDILPPRSLLEQWQSRRV